MVEARSGYTDFDVAIGRRTGGSYPLELIDSPFGQFRTEMAPPFDDAHLTERLAEIRQIMATPSYAIGPPQIERAARARDFGVALFHVLLGSGLARAYAESRSIAEAGGQFLRINMRVRAPELAALPWELLYDPVLDAHVLLKDQVSLVRMPESAGPVKRLSVDGPLRILGIVVDLPSAPSIGAQAEREHVAVALADLQARDLVELEWLANPSWRGLLTAMERGPWHVVHFIGHAGFDDVSGSGYVVVASDESEGQEPVPFELSATDLAAAVADSGEARLAVINACESGTGRAADGSGGTAHRLVEAGLSAAIGMQTVIHDDAAIEFSRQLYEHIARMRPLDRAVAGARKAMDLAVPQTLEWAIPTLHIRAANGVIFERPTSVEPSVRVSELLAEGISCFHERNLVRAVEVFDQAMMIEPDRTDIVVWRTLVDAAGESATPEAADALGRSLPALDGLIAERPGDLDLVAIRGIGLATIGRHEDAITDLDRSIDAAPNLAGTRIARARCHLASGTPRRAIADLDVAVRLTPHSAIPLVLRADAYGAVDDHGNAIADLTAALAIQPTGPFRRLRSAQFAALRGVREGGERSRLRHRAAPLGRAVRTAWRTPIPAGLLRRR